VSVFVDTSGLYALLVRSEAQHSRVAKAFSRLLQDGRVLVTTNYVLVETSALLQNRFGLPAVRDLERRIAPLLRIRWIDEGRHRRGSERLFALDQRQVSLVDCISFAVMEAEGIQEVLALDRDFEKQGFRVLPS
jgi:predicted nucleic acid-binding protein